MGSLASFRGYARPHLRALSAGLGMRIGELLADFAKPWPLALVVDSVLGHRPVGGPLKGALGPFAASPTLLLTAAVAVSLLLAFASAFLDYWGDRVMNGAGERITAAIRADLFSHLHRLPPAYHDTHSVGELASRVSEDTDRIEDALVDVFSTVVPGFLSLAGLLTVMLVVNWRLGLVAVAAGPLLVLTISRYRRLTRSTARARRAREGTLSGFVAETLIGVRAVHALGRHDVHDRRFADLNAGTLDAGLRAVDVRARFTPLVEVGSSVGMAALVWFGAFGVLHGSWTLGVLLVEVSYLNTILKPIRSLSQLSLTLSTGAASAERVRAVLDEPRLPAGPTPAGKLPARARGRVEFRDVAFGYGRGAVLDGVSFKIAPGERVALVGPNGAGKSTVLSLLTRLYEPSSGTVLLDGCPVERLPLRWLRDQFAVVLQDTFLFSGSLGDNIAYGRPSAPAKAIREAARLALVDEFVDGLPHGFDTILGDHGVGLSGGQRQRVAIARALLRSSSVVVLDEPTSSLDLGAERLVVEALRSLMAGRTVVMATHRPALLGLADRMLEVNGGVILPRPVPRRFASDGGAA